jgi:DNA-binding beta-propeller fold protein YncE
VGAGRFTLLVTGLLALAAAAARAPSGQLATGRIALTPWPYLPGSVIPLRVDGFAPPFHTVALGRGRIGPGGLFEIPAHSAPGGAFIVAGNATGLATASLRVAVPPPANRDLLIVASYDDGLVFHDARNFATLAVLGTGGAPGDVAVDRQGRIAAPDTQGNDLTLAALRPWNVQRVWGVVLGDEVAVDGPAKAIFVTDRDVAGSGALTRISADGRVTRVTTGVTAEGLAVDERHQIVYVANTNDGTVAAIDPRTMRVIRRFHAVDRVFSLALSDDGRRLYAVSNESASSPFAAPGSVVELALHGTPRVIARSPELDFPLGIALDAASQTLFVTDEAREQVDVLDARTLREKHVPLHTCSTPWKPTLDAAGRRLYIPCAGANAIDAFDTRSLRRIRNAPFATGSYPLALAIWRPSEPLDSARDKLGR